MADDNDNIINGTAVGETISGLGGSDTIDGLGGADILFGGSGDDTFRMTGSTIDDGERVYGGSRRFDTGIDTLDLSGITFEGIVDNPTLGNITVGNVVDLAAGSFGSVYANDVGLGATEAQIRGVENVVGSRFADFITGDSEANLIRGGDGDDIVNGGDGEDHLFGEGGNDTFEISGDIFATGLDHIDGGTGRNTIDASGLTNSQAAAHLDLVAGTLGLSYQGPMEAGATGGTPRITNVQDFIGGGGADSVVASAEANHINGGGGDDTVSYQHSTAGVIVDAFAGTASGGYAEGDTFYDMEGVIGSAFADRIMAEEATGGGGADTFVGFNEYIYDFRPTEGDKIDFSGLGEALGKPVDFSDVSWSWDAADGSWDLTLNGIPTPMEVTMPDGEQTFTESMFIFDPAPAQTQSAPDTLPVFGATDVPGSADTDGVFVVNDAEFAGGREGAFDGLLQGGEVSDTLGFAKNLVDFAVDHFDAATLPVAT